MNILEKSGLAEQSWWGCALGMVLLLMGQLSYGQVYKWVDEDGVVHYSDKKPMQNAATLDLDPLGLPAPVSVASPTPIVYQQREPSRIMYYVVPEFSLSNEAKAKRNLANFYFGGDCDNPTSVNWEKLNERYGYDLPDPEALMMTGGSAARELGYRVHQIPKTRLKTALETNEGLLLDITVVDIKIDACVNSLVRHTGGREKQNTYSQNLADFSLADYQKSQSWIKVRWDIRESAGATPLYSGYTEGVSDQALRDEGTVKEAIRSSFDASILSLFGEREVVALLNPVAIAESQKLARPTPPSRSTDSSTLSSTADRQYRQYQKRAKFAQALALSAPLKMSVTEYYMVNGRWPLSLYDVGISENDLVEPGLVESARLGKDGIIRFDLSPVFGLGSELLLVPEDKNVRIRWACRTNVPEAYIAGECELL